eukprot:3632841-Amphidinium_carterae.1
MFAEVARTTFCPSHSAGRLGWPSSYRPRSQKSKPIRAGRTPPPQKPVAKKQAAIQVRDQQHEVIELRHDPDTQILSHGDAYLDMADLVSNEHVRTQNRRLSEAFLASEHVLSLHKLLWYG